MLQVAGVAFGPLRTLLGTESLTLAQFALGALASAVPGILVWLSRRRTLPPNGGSSAVNG